MSHDYGYTTTTNNILGNRCIIYLNRQQKTKKYRTRITSKLFFTFFFRNTHSFVYCCALSGPVAEIKQKELRNFIAIFCKEARYKQRNEGRGDSCNLLSQDYSLMLCIVYTTDRRPTNRVADSGPVQTVLYYRLENPDKVVFQARAPVLNPGLRIQIRICIVLESLSGIRIRVKSRIRFWICIKVKI
jgi:hypothetical protein